MTTPTVTDIDVKPLSDYTVTQSGLVDTSGLPLTSSTGVVRIVVKTQNFVGPEQLNDVMTYTGTGGVFIYALPAANLPIGVELFVLIQQWNTGGSVIHDTNYIRLRPIV